MTEKIMISVVMPALNEEKNILPAIDDTLAAFDELKVSGEIVVVNDGSSDATPALVTGRCERPGSRVRMISHEKPQGIGASFWDGASHAKGEAVCMLPGDNENDPREIIRYVGLLKDVDIVIPFVFNRGARSRFRSILSGLYLWIINTTFGTSLYYTNGTVLYRRSLLASLDARNSGFFYQTDILIRLLRQGYLFVEVPYRLRTRVEGGSKAVSLKSLKAVMRGYLKLVYDLKIKNRMNKKGVVADSMTAARRRGA